METSKKCPSVEFEKCIVGERCHDGICRKKCKLGNSCPVKDGKKMIMCANGFCAKSLFHCAGENACTISKPYRCSTGKCVK